MFCKHVVGNQTFSQKPHVKKMIAASRIQDGLLQPKSNFDCMSFLSSTNALDLLRDFPYYSYRLPALLGYNHTKKLRSSNFEHQGD